MSDEEMLQHYGILGMKWGVRRTPAQLTRANGRAGKTESSDEIKKMSDSELRSKINRLQMEKQYKQLTSSEISVGRKFVQDVLTNAAKQTATNYVSKYMTKHIIYDNCASIKGRGISHQRDRFEVHLRKYYRLYGNEGWILFGDFSKFYDNIIHEIAKRELRCKDLPKQTIQNRHTISRNALVNLTPNNTSAIALCGCMEEISNRATSPYIPGSA